MKQMKILTMNIWSSNHNAHATLSISNSLHNKCMNLLHLPEKYHINILDGGTDTCVLGQGWEVLSVHNKYCRI
jgi:phosphoserine aminotransferase